MQTQGYDTNSFPTHKIQNSFEQVAYTVGNVVYKSNIERHYLLIYNSNVNKFGFTGFRLRQKNREIA